MSVGETERLFTFWRAEQDALERTDHHERSIWDLQAFLFRYGTSDELRDRALEAETLLAWWQTRGGPFQPDGDQGAIQGLRVAADRLADLHERAVLVEADAKARGYEFDPKDRVLKESRGTPGPQPALLTQAVELAYRWLTTEHGFEERNTADLRKAIRECLSLTFHPDLLSTEKGNPIHSRVNKLTNY